MHKTPSSQSKNNLFNCFSLFVNKSTMLVFYAFFFVFFLRRSVMLCWVSVCKRKWSVCVRACNIECVRHCSPCFGDEMTAKSLVAAWNRYTEKRDDICVFLGKCGVYIFWHWNGKWEKKKQFRVTAVCWLVSSDTWQSIRLYLVLLCWTTT